MAPVTKRFFPVVSGKLSCKNFVNKIVLNVSIFSVAICPYELPAVKTHFKKVFVNIYWFGFQPT